MNARELIWSYPAGPGLEHFRLARDDDGFLADGLYVGCHENGEPYRVHYRIRIGPDWRMRSAVVKLLMGNSHGPAEISLAVDDAGFWTDGAGATLEDLNGCHEADLYATPFTNTLAIRRLGLVAGESAEISVAYIEVPEMTVKPVRQRYTCIRPLGPDGGEYRYEALFKTFSGDLTVDADGLVITYSGSFERVWDSGTE